MTKESHGDRTKKKILQAGVDLWPNVSPTTISKALGMAHAGVLYHFPKAGLRDAVAVYAVNTGASRVIVQLVGENHPAVADLSPDDRASHFAAVQGEKALAHN